MANVAYMNGRKKYARPQAMLWSENSGTVQTITSAEEGTQTFFVPLGNEVGTDPSQFTDQSLADQFIILSDDNRSPIEFTNERIERRERMVNGRMRSHHIADKLSINVSWDNLPSRSYASLPSFNVFTGVSPDRGKNSLEYTTDGGAGGVDMLKWYEDHQGSFWVFLAYDKYSNFGVSNDRYAQMQKYNQVLEMFVSDFSYTVTKRGANNFDFWNIKVTLEEV
jgi:hypothetical protein